MEAIKLDILEQNYRPLQAIKGGKCSRRNTCAGAYLFGFNGQEKDNEIQGQGNAYTAMFWEYDPRLGRRWNVDPVDKPWESSYATFGGNPILYVDPHGDDYFKSKGGSVLYRDGNTDATYTSDDGETFENIGNTWVHTESYEDDIEKYKITYTEVDGKLESASHPKYNNMWLVYPKVIKNYRPLYSKTEMETAEKWSIGILTTMLGGYGVWANGANFAWRAFLAKGAIDATIQGTANYATNGGDLKQAVGDINTIESVMVGLGVNPYIIATTSGFHSYSINERYQGSFNGGITTEEGVKTMLIGLAFAAGNNYVTNKMNLSQGEQQAKYWFGNYLGRSPAAVRTLVDYIYGVSGEAMENIATDGE